MILPGCGVMPRRFIQYSAAPNQFRERPFALPLLLGTVDRFGRPGRFGIHHAREDAQRYGHTGTDGEVAYRDA